MSGAGCFMISSRNQVRAPSESLIDLIVENGLTDHFDFVIYLF